MVFKKITTPIMPAVLKNLAAGEQVLLSGLIYTARDQAHRRLVDLIKTKKKLPFDLNNAMIYYCGPTAKPEGKVIGACGPTTSSRMDSFTLDLLKAGVIGLIGKGRRSKTVRFALKQAGAVYFLAPAGCGALLAKQVLSAKIVAFKELGPEAIYCLTVKDFPLIVGIDSQGRSVYSDL